MWILDLTLPFTSTTVLDKVFSLFGPRATHLSKIIWDSCFPSTQMDGVDTKCREGIWSDIPKVRRLRLLRQGSPSIVSATSAGRSQCPQTTWSAMDWLKCHLQSLSPTGKGHNVKNKPEREQRAEPGSVWALEEMTKEEDWESTGKTSPLRNAFYKRCPSVWDFLRLINRQATLEQRVYKMSWKAGSCTWSVWNQWIRKVVFFFYSKSSQNVFIRRIKWS